MNERKEYRGIEGSIHYDSFSPSEIEKHHRGDVVYCQVDETLRFAAKMRTPQNRLPDMSREEHVSQITEVLETIFGLRHVKNTPVGDAAIRGVSGGEKKRVSIAEALATRSRLNSWDNSTRGLE